MADPHTIIEHASHEPFAETLARIERAIADAGLTIFARIDHAEGARQVGLDMLPATVLIYGHPKGGTPIMQAAPLAALDLPLRVLVRADADGKAFIAFYPMAAVLRDAGVPEDLATRLDGTQALLVKGLQA